jgi:hypothetical protein
MHERLGLQKRKDAFEQQLYLERHRLSAKLRTFVDFLGDELRESVQAM